MRFRPLALLFIAGLSFSGIRAADEIAAPGAASGSVLFWNDPADIASRDLFYGPGGEAHQPKGPFVFVKEDLDGTNPKFVVQDGDGVKWKVKMGAEARPEVIATRFVWAAGYYANEDYFLADMQIDDMPAHLHRGQDQVGPNGTVHNVRLKREDYKKIGIWQWKKAPFAGTREWNGLRVMMAFINNWDLKDVNNAIYDDHRGHRIYLVSDLGASFGSAGAAIPLDKSKGNVTSFLQSKFIEHVSAQAVDFEGPARPEAIWVFKPRDYTRRIGMEWLGKNIPRADARWIGDLLARLSPQQIRDAFRAAGYAPWQQEEYARILERRIKQLEEL